MGKSIDCMIIGHNEMNFEEYERTVKQIGIQSGAYRDLNFNFIKHNNKAYYAPEVFNLYCQSVPPLRQGDIFSATIAYLGTYLNRAGLTFDFVNSFQEEKDELTEKLKKEDILTAAITTTLYVSAFPIVEIVDLVRKHNPGVKIIIGGPFISSQARTQDKMVLDYLFDNLGADIYVNSSQGEAALVQIIRALKTNSPLALIKNIYYKENNAWVAAAVSTENNRLSENMVNWDLFSQRVGEYVNTRTAISCPYTCAFCGFPQHAGKYQTAEEDAVEAELNRLNRIGRVKHVNFIDDTFNIPPKRFKEMLRRMIKNKYAFGWHSHFRCQLADREMVELMKQSGCRGVFLGLESGSQQILGNMNKTATIDAYLEGIELLKQQDIIVYASFIVGFPGETHETAGETMELIKKTQPDFYRAQLWYCEPLTPIWKRKEEFNIKGSHFKWSHATMDSNTACDIIDEIFLSIDKSIWVPHHNFAYESVFNLTNRGMSIQQVKNFIRSFNLGIREKLKYPSRKEVSAEVIEQVKNSCQSNTHF